jgi:hypothetical protein
MQVTPDSVFLDVDSSGTWTSYRGKYDLDENNRIFPESASIPDFFLKGVIRFSGNPDPTAWSQEFQGGDTLYFGIDYTCPCGARGMQVSVGMELLALYRITE